MVALRAPIFALLLVAPWAGCLGDAPAPALAPTTAPSTPIPVDDAFPVGLLQGQVVDDEQAPVPGAQIEVIGLHSTIETDGSGSFSFGRVNAGDYLLDARREGFVPARVGVTVSADRAVVNVIVLEKVRPPTDRIEVVERVLYMQCQWTYGAADRNATQSSMFGKNYCEQTQLGVALGEYRDLSEGKIPYAAGLVAVLVEAQWDRSTVGSRDLALRVGVGGLTGKSATAKAEGATPLFAHLSPLDLAGIAETGNITFDIGAANSLTDADAADAGLATHQRVETAITLFYVKPPADVREHRQFR